jgi:hypothetical protein
MVRVAVSFVAMVFICNDSAAGPPNQAGAPVDPTADNAPPAADDTDIIFPDVGDWVLYCDRRPKRTRAKLGELREKLLRQCFFEIDQLMKDCISHSELSECLGIGMGLAALIIRYAEEDVAQVCAGTFNMNQA